MLVGPGVLKNGEHDRRKELDFAYLFVVDVTRQLSYLLVAGGRELALAQAVTCLNWLLDSGELGEEMKRCEQNTTKFFWTSYLLTMRLQCVSCVTSSCHLKCASLDMSRPFQSDPCEKPSQGSKRLARRSRIQRP